MKESSKKWILIGAGCVILIAAAAFALFFSGKLLNADKQLPADQQMFQDLLGAAKQGDSESQFMTGRCYLEGKGIKKDHLEAVKWFKTSADRGNSNGMNALGVCYEYGRGVKKDPAKAIELYQKAVKREIFLRKIIWECVISAVLA